MIKRMLVPTPWQGVKDNIPSFAGYEWVRRLPDKKIYLALFQGWTKDNLPSGYDYYIVSFHLEAVDIAWLKQQRVTGPIFVLFDGQAYDLQITNVYFIPFFYWHYQLDTMHRWFGSKEKPQPKYKFSAVCNRISQNKIWITTKLLEVAHSSSQIVLNSWIEEKNVHGWQLTGSTTLDDLTQIFQETYLGQEIKIDDFDNATQNKQHITATPWQPLYQDCVIHFTNESFHYSGMLENNQFYIWPGPFITEKTLKCLLGATAFVPVGQFETYKTLKDLGFNFEYGFDISWDSDPGNITRCESVVNLIDRLNQFDVDSLKTLTEDCNQFNQNHIVSGNFFQRCQSANNKSIEQIYDLLI